VSDSIQVDPADLLISGQYVGSHAEDIYAAHRAADARIDGALSQWVGSSLAAMSAKAAAWQVTTAALHGRMSDHAYAMREIGIGFEETDDHNAERIHGVGPRSNSSSVWGRLV